MSIKEIDTLEDLKDLTEEIKELYFTEKFNEQIDGLIPNWIKIINFDWHSKFNYNCEMLPEGLKEINFNMKKNHILEEIINFPRSLTHLTLGVATSSKKLDISL